jgi:sugar lactone lactonase YvrE
VPSGVSPTITSIDPLRVVEGGRITLHGSGFPVDRLPGVTIGGIEARIAFASTRRLILTIPGGLEGGSTPIRVENWPGTTALVSVGAPWAAGLHQVDNPVFDREGNLYVTYSGPRGQEAPVSVFRVTRAGTREPFASGIVNATSMAFGPDNHLYVSSRFEGAVYRVDQTGAHETVATDLGVACGIAFDEDGWMYVGDRSGTIFRVRDGKASAFATLPASVAAFHLAIGPSGDLFVAGPTLGSYDTVYHIDRDGEVAALAMTFGRPQGLAFSPDGMLHVVEALAGSSGVYRVTKNLKTTELVVSGAALVGVAFGPGGEMVVASNETAYRFD